MIVEIEVDLESMKRIKENMKNEGNLNKKLFLYLVYIMMYNNNIISI